MNTTPSDSQIVYEFPMSNRIRNFLRYEYLIDRLNHTIDSDSALSALQTLTELIELNRYIDIKSELLQNLQWQEQQLRTFTSSELVDIEETENLLREKTHIIDMIDEFIFPTEDYGENEFLTSVRLRLSVPGGVCCFDLPLLHAWLNHSPEKIRDNLTEWAHPFNTLKQGIDSCLSLTRMSTEPETRTANGGFYNKSFPAIVRPYSMIRITLDKDGLCYPEVSAGKRHFTIYFFENHESQDLNKRFEQSQKDITFGLACCSL